jgi:hypothetical protein
MSATVKDRVVDPVGSKGGIPHAWTRALPLAQR